MTTSLSSLDQALQIAGALTVPTAAPAAAPAAAPPFASFWEGRTVHWSTGLLTLGAACSLITLIAGVALSQTPLIITGGFYLATCLTGAYYTHTFSQYKSLESHVKILAGQVLEFKQQTADREAANEQTQRDLEALRELNGQLEQATRKDRAALEKQESSFKKTLEELQTVENDLRKQLEGVTVQLTLKTEAFERQTVKLGKLLSGYQTQVEELSRQIDELKKENDELSAHLQALEKTRASYAEKTHAFDQENDELKAALKEIPTDLSTPNLNLNKIDERTQQLKKATEALNELTRKLEKMQTNMQNQK